MNLALRDINNAGRANTGFSSFLRRIVRSAVRCMRLQMGSLRLGCEIDRTATSGLKEPLKERFLWLKQTLFFDYPGRSII